MAYEYYKRTNSDSQGIKTEFFKLDGKLATTIQQNKPSYAAIGYYKTVYQKHINEPYAPNYPELLMRTGAVKITQEEFELYNEKMK